MLQLSNIEKLSELSQTCKLTNTFEIIPRSTKDSGITSQIHFDTLSFLEFVSVLTKREERAGGLGCSNISSLSLPI